MKRATLLSAALLALIVADTAAAELRFGTATDGTDSNAQGIGDIAQLDGGYDPADGSVAVSVAFRDGAPATFPFALYRGRVIKRGDDCERRGRGPAFRGTVRIRTSPYAMPSSGTLAGREVLGRTFVTEGGLRVTATFKDALLADRGYRCMVVSSPADRAELFFLGFEPKKPKPKPKPDPKPKPKPKPKPRLTPKTAAAYVARVLAAKHGTRNIKAGGNRYIECPRSAFTRYRGRRAAFCVFRVALRGDRAVAGSVGVRLLKGTFRKVGLKQFEFRVRFSTCELPDLSNIGIADQRLRIAGLPNCEQATGIARKVFRSSPGTRNFVLGEGKGFRRLARFTCRIRRRGSRSTARCTNEFGDRVSFDYTLTRG